MCHVEGKGWQNFRSNIIISYPSPPWLYNRRQSVSPFCRNIYLCVHNVHIHLYIHIFLYSLDSLNRSFIIDLIGDSLIIRYYYVQARSCATCRSVSAVLMTATRSGRFWHIYRHDTVTAWRLKSLHIYVHTK